MPMRRPARVAVTRVVRPARVRVTTVEVGVARTRLARARPATESTVT